jgi:hypothetical protein
MRRFQAANVRELCGKSRTFRSPLCLKYSYLLRRSTVESDDLLSCLAPWRSSSVLCSYRSSPPARDGRKRRPVRYSLHRTRSDYTRDCRQATGCLALDGHGAFKDSKMQGNPLVEDGLLYATTLHVAGARRSHRPGAMAVRPKYGLASEQFLREPSCAPPMTAERG